MFGKASIVLPGHELVYRTTRISEAQTNLQDGVICHETQINHPCTALLIQNIYVVFGLSCLAITFIYFLVYFSWFLNDRWRHMRATCCYEDHRHANFLKNKLNLADNNSYNPDDDLSNLSHSVTHLAVIMDGNRRYGKKLAHQEGGGSSVKDIHFFCKEFFSQLSDNSTSHSCGNLSHKGKACLNDKYLKLLSLIQSTSFEGHRLGGEKLIEFIKDCIDARISMLTVYAFSTENWDRPKPEIHFLMTLFFLLFDKVRSVANNYGIFIRFITTDPGKLPAQVLKMMEVLECESRCIAPRRITVNMCVSYNGQSEMAVAFNRIFQRRLISGDRHSISKEDISPEMLRSITQPYHEDHDKNIFTPLVPNEPQLIIRTGGECRISNFLLYECAYSELIFIEKKWPEITRRDLKEAILTYLARHRRFGK